MTREFTDLPDGKVRWDIRDEHRTVLANGVANNRKKAYAASAHAFRVIDQRNQKRSGNRHNRH